MAEGTSYWTLRRRVRDNVARQITNLQQTEQSTHSDYVYRQKVDSGNETIGQSSPHSVSNESIIDSSVNDSGSESDSCTSQENQWDVENYFGQYFLCGSETDTSSDSDDEDDFFRCKLRDWAVKYQISNLSLSELLEILRPSHPELPKDPRTLLKTLTSYNILEIGGGQYYHFGIETGILKMLRSCVESLSDGFHLKLQLNIDGLPLFKSTSHQFWPILGKVQNLQDQSPFVIGLYFGVKKPNDIDAYLHEFLNEYAQIQTNGLVCNGKHFHIHIDSVICDAPARAFVKCVKSYSGYHGCDKCTQEGEWRNKMTFPETSAPLRTDASFDEMRDDYHHNGISPFTRISLGMVSQFPLDYMHLVCLGVMKRLIVLWMKGPLKSRLGAGVIQKISDSLIRLKNNVPTDFARRPRSIHEIDRWKATEFRQFLLYTGIVVLRDNLHAHMFENFLYLSVGIHILLNDQLSQSYNQYAHDLLVAFVRHFYQIYGVEMAVYNVHGLVHLATDAAKYGSLDRISAFPFENFMHSLKKLVRKPTFPLPQVIRRLSEQATISQETKSFPILKKSHHFGPVPDLLCLGSQYQIVRTEKILLKLSEKDRCVRIAGKICLVKNLICQDGEVYAVYSEFASEENFFTSPLDSKLLGILLVSNLQDTVKHVNLKDIESKCVLLPYRGKHVALPYTNSTCEKYAVVEFVEEKEVEVVPVKWLTGNNQKCYWPDLMKSTSKIQAAIRQAVTPTVHFACLKVRMLYQGDYDQARKKLNLAEIQSDLQTEAEEDKQEDTRRQKRPNPRYQHLDSETEDDEEVSQRKRKHDVAPLRRSPRKETPKAIFVPPPSDSEDDEEVSQKKRKHVEVPLRRSPRKTTPKAPFVPPPSEPLLPIAETEQLEIPRISPGPSRGQSVSVKAVDKALITGLEEVKAQVSINTKLLQAVMKKLDNVVRGDVEHSVDVDLSREKSFPLKTKGEAERLNVDLENEEKFKTTVMALGTLGGESLKMTVRRILKYMFQNDLAKQTNFIGKGGKLGFSKLVTMKDAVYKAVRRNRLCFDATEAEIDNFIKEWFRNASDRDGGRKKRMEKKKNQEREIQERENNEDTA